MAQEEIIEKLNKFLPTHDPLTEECQIVYLMVEIRKIIDHEKSSEMYPLLKFYADWTLHTKKDYITPEIQQMMEVMYKTAEAEIKNPALTKGGSPIMKFAYMDSLGKEMKVFLENHGMDSSLARKKERWIAFVNLLVKVLENQPIITPTSDIESFFFQPANDGCVIGILIFVKPIKEYNLYKFMSYYQ